MRPDLTRSLLLFLCTASAFVTLGRAPGAIAPKTREIEITINSEGRPGRDKRAPVTWQGGSRAS